MRYEIQVPVASAEGYQIWAIRDANTADDALRQLRDGGGEFVEEEVEVTGLNFGAAEVLAD